MRQQSSLLQTLRRLMPQRPLSQGEALRIAELQANRLLQASGIDTPGTPNSVVSSLRFVEVVAREDLPVSGAARWLKPRWLILLNAQEPEVRRRFSLMHEFKHILDDPYIDFLYPDSWVQSGEKRREVIADYFAACMLMPKRLLKTAYFSRSQEVSELAGLFGTSEIAMRFRLQQLGLLTNLPRCATPLEYLRRKPTIAA